MGTRSIVRFKDEYENDKTVVTVYRQMDGYPEGRGVDLAEFLKGFSVVSGYSLDDETREKIANGMGCLAAQWIKHEKEGLGNVYIVPDGPDNTLDADYIYNVSLYVRGLVIELKDGDDNISTYTPEEFLEKYD